MTATLSEAVLAAGLLNMITHGQPPPLVQQLAENSSRLEAFFSSESY